MENKNIFINCPFDADYVLLLKALVFTIIFVGFTPKLTLENSDSSQTRITKISELISISKFGIHDLSRIKALKKGEYFRLNMPFELGMDFGNKCYSDTNNDKKLLILCVDKHDYQKAISDIAGCDIKTHENDAYKLITVLREWFHETVGVSITTGPTGIWNRYMDFLFDLDTNYLSKGYSEDDIKNISISEFMKFSNEWKRLANVN